MRWPMLGLANAYSILPFWAGADRLDANAKAEDALMFATYFSAAVTAASSAAQLHGEVAKRERGQDHCFTRMRRSQACGDLVRGIVLDTPG